MGKDISNFKLKQYFLGDVSPEESEQIGGRIISDDEFVEDLVAAEDSLIEDYLEDELSDKEIELFHQNFLISEERKEQIETIRNLKRYAQKARARESLEKQDSRLNPTFLQTLFERFSLSPAGALVSVLIIGLLIGVVWVTLVNGPNDLSPVESEYAQLNKANFSDLTPYENFSNLVLFDGLSRGGERSKSLVKRNLTERVLFKLALPGKSDVNGVYRVELLKSQKVVFKQVGIQTYTNPSGEELRFLLPSASLDEGTYQIRVTGNNEKESQTLYSFTIE